MTQFVRVTYQECESVEGEGGMYRPLGMEQDIRMAGGYLELSDEYGALQYNIVEGKLHRIDGMSWGDRAQ